MPLTDVEIETLEQYLDGALRGDEAAAIAHRLQEPEHAAALQVLGAQRQARRSLFAANEPGEMEIDRFVTRVNHGVARRRNSTRLVRALRIGGAVAACVAVSFVTGWQIRGHRLASTTTDPVVIHGPPPAKMATAATFQVALTDEHGQVTAVQDFDSLEKAKEFSEDLKRWQERQEQFRNGAAAVVADRF